MCVTLAWNERYRLICVIYSITSKLKDNDEYERSSSNFPNGTAALDKKSYEQPGTFYTHGDLDSALDI